MTFKASKTIRKAGGFQKLGNVQVQIDLDENGLFLPGFEMPLDLKMDINRLHREIKFDEIRIRLKETQSWNSIMESKTGNDNFLTETTLLARECVNEWEDHDDEGNVMKRTMSLRNLVLEIPEDAACDKEVGLVRVHHFLDVKLISHGRLVDNIGFKFPVVIGGEQYEETPHDHPLNFHNENTIDKVLARAIAGAIIWMTNTAGSIRPARKVARSATDALSQEV